MSERDEVRRERLKLKLQRLRTRFVKTQAKLAKLDRKRERGAD